LAVAYDVGGGQMNTIYDVAIIGGGLAGCSAAVHLAALGYKVVLAEAKTYPHDKVCGEFLSPECRGLLEELGVMPALRAVYPTEITHARITVPGGAEWTTVLPEAGMGISRRTLDSALVQWARRLNVTALERTIVTDIDGSLDSGFRLVTRKTRGEGELQARAVIGAHGKRSVVDRTLHRSFLNKQHPFLGLKRHFHGPPIPGRVDLHAFSGGYCGMSEVEGGKTNVCLLVRQESFARLQGDIPAFVEWMKVQNPHLAAWLSGAEPLGDRWLSIAQIPFAQKQPVDGDVLMAGDSAGLIAPLAGDGMAMALQAGKLASSWLDSFFRRQISAEDVRRGYAEAWHAQFRGRLRVGRVLQAVMLRPQLLALGLRAVQTVPALGRYFVANTRDMGLANR
jgi:menaquinone-9 beta-reductase